MPDFNVEVSFDVYCSCGNGICDHADATDKGYQTPRKITVRPCEDCIAKSYEQGWEEGQAALVETAKEELKKEGRE